MRLASVLDQHEPAPLGDSAESAHVGHLAVKVHRQEGTRARPAGGCRSGGIEAVVVLGDVSHHRDAARLRHRLERGDEGRCGNDDLLAGLESRRQEPEPKSVKPARDADAMVDAAVRGERLLEKRDRRAVRERARVQKLADLLEESVLQSVREPARGRETGPRADLLSPALTSDRP